MLDLYIGRRGGAVLSWGGGTLPATSHPQCARPRPRRRPCRTGTADSTPDDDRAATAAGHGDAHAPTAACQCVWVNGSPGWCRCWAEMQYGYALSCPVSGWVSDRGGREALGGVQPAVGPSPPGAPKARSRRCHQRQCLRWRTERHLREPVPAHLGRSARSGLAGPKIGRASCRERV